MTPKYSAQWWEKVTARREPISTEHDAPTTTGSIAPIDQPEIPQTKTKTRKSVAGKPTCGSSLGYVAH
jgi:hypothetical protein